MTQLLLDADPLDSEPSWEYIGPRTLNSGHCLPVERFPRTDLEGPVPVESRSCEKESFAIRMGSSACVVFSNSHRPTRRPARLRQPLETWMRLALPRRTRNPRPGG